MHSPTTGLPRKLPRDILAGWQVLVVDDEIDSLEVAARMLRHYGAAVYEAHNGQEGAAAAQEHAPYLRFILSDLSMPVMDGWGLLYELKQETRTRDIPVIALTAHAMTGDRERALAAGFHNYLTKPLTPATFMAQLYALLVDIPVLAAELKPV